MFERARDDYLAETVSNHSADTRHDSLTDVRSLASVYHSDENVASPSSSALNERSDFDDDRIDADHSFDVYPSNSVSNESATSDCKSVGSPENVEIFEEQLRTVFAE